MFYRQAIYNLWFVHVAGNFCLNCRQSLFIITFFRTGSVPSQSAIAGWQEQSHKKIGYWEKSGGRQIQVSKFLRYCK